MLQILKSIQKDKEINRIGRLHSCRGVRSADIDWRVIVSIFLSENYSNEIMDKNFMNMLKNVKLLLDKIFRVGGV